MSAALNSISSLGFSLDGATLRRRFLQGGSSESRILGRVAGFGPTLTRLDLWLALLRIGTSAANV